MNHGNEPILALASLWAQEFANAMEAMAGERPALEVNTGLAGERLWNGRGKSVDGQVIWWKQVLDASPGSTVWIGTPRALCSELGQSILAAAGIESAEESELKDTYLEVVRQSLGSFAGAVGAQISQEVVCTEGAEEEPPPDTATGCEIEVGRTGEPLPPLLFLLNKELMEATSRASTPTELVESDASIAESFDSEPPLSARASSTLNLLMDVELPVSVSFGRTRVRMQEILKLITGSIIELDRSISEPVEVIVNNCVVARGEVVVVDGNYGVRINDVMSRSERLRESRRSLLPLHGSEDGSTGRKNRSKN